MQSKDRYRLTLDSGGIAGYWKVQKKYFLIWVTLNKYSIYVYGNVRAYNKANEAIYFLRKQNG